MVAIKGNMEQYENKMSLQHQNTQNNSLTRMKRKNLWHIKESKLQSS